METPSSMRMASISQSQKIKKEEPNSRSALVDVTNDSPIVGLAMKSNSSEKTPSSSFVKNWVRVKNTPGSGEALLRGQVKTLLQKVEEEAEFVHNKVSLGDRPPFRVVLGIPGPSPVQILAPTPANTPQVLSFSEKGNKTCDVEEIGTKNGLIQIAEAVKPEVESLNTQECLINRALLFDSPDKSEITENVSSISSSVSYQGNEIKSYGSSSDWSLQVNVSGKDDYYEEQIEDFNEEDYVESLDDLCEGLSKMTVKVDREGSLPEFNGKHTRFVYNSDDEIEGEEVIREKVSPSVVVLKGLPVPEGKHLRFHDEEDDEEWGI